MIFPEIFNVIQVRDGKAIWDGRVKINVKADERGTYAMRAKNPAEGQWELGDLVWPREGMMAG